MTGRAGSSSETWLLAWVGLALSAAPFAVAAVLGVVDVVNAVSLADFSRRDPAVAGSWHAPFGFAWGLELGPLVLVLALMLGLPAVVTGVLCQLQRRRVVLAVAFVATLVGGYAWLFSGAGSSSLTSLGMVQIVGPPMLSLGGDLVVLGLLTGFFFWRRPARRRPDRPPLAPADTMTA